MYMITGMFVSPAKNSAQCADVQSTLDGIREQTDFKTNLLQLSSCRNLLIIKQPVPECCMHHPCEVIIIHNLFNVQTVLLTNADINYEEDGVQTVLRVSRDHH